VIELLLSRGAKIARKAEFTPLQCAAERNDAALVKLFLDRGADPKLHDRDKTTALHAAVRVNRTADVSEALLRAGADPNAIDGDGNTPLHLAARRYHDVDAIVRALLSSGAKADGKALCAAASMDALPTVVRLLDAGVDIESRDEEGKTPFTLAAENGYVDLAMELLYRGANIEDAAREHATENGRTEILRLLDGEDVASPGLPVAYFEASKKANAHASAGRWKEALEIYLTIPATLRTRTFELASNLGYAYQQLGRHAEAVVAFEEAIKRKPERAHIPKAACYSYSELERWDAMHVAARRAAELAPNDDYVWQQVAIASSRKGDLPSAIEAGKRALELNPKNGYAAYNLGVDLMTAKKKGWKDALARAFEHVPSLRDHARTDDSLDPLRDNAEFQALLEPR